MAAPPTGIENPGPMSPNPALVPAATLAPDTPGTTDGSGRLRAEQLTLMCRQWQRVPVPVLAIATVVIYLTWDFVPRWVAFTWAAVTVAGVVARMRLCSAILKEGLAAQPERWSRLLTVFAGANGIVSGAA